MYLYGVVSWPLLCPLLLLSDLIKSLLGFSIAVLQVASPSQERTCVAGRTSCAQFPGLPV